MAISTKKIFGKNICRLRTQAGLTQEALAERADMSRRFLQEIEAGKKNASMMIAAKLRKALKCSWDSIAEGL